MRHALAAGHRARETTAIASGRSSIASVAIRLAHSHLGPPAGRRALVIGNGETGSKAARALRGAGVDVEVTSGRVAPASIAELLTAVDLVVSCTGAPHHLFGPGLFATAAERRGDRALVVLDLALPRDVDPRTHDVPGVHLYDLDDVGGEALRTAHRRSGAVSAAEAVVAQEAEHFSRWFAALEVEPTIKDLRRHSKHAVLDALRRSGLAANAGEATLDEVSDAIVTRLLHAPSRRLREAARNGDPDALAQPVREIFGLAG